MCPSPGKRAATQLLESGAIVVILILILEWIAPWAAGRKADPNELAFALIFGVTCVVMHVTLAYLRPLSKLELSAMVEEAMQKDLLERTHPDLPRVRQMAQWAANDPRWEQWAQTTEVEVPVLRPSPKRR